MDIPYGAGIDHAVGATLFDRPGEPPAVLVVYDNPAPGRLAPNGASVIADVFPLPKKS
jgi:hypothetical protein